MRTRAITKSWNRLKEKNCNRAISGKTEIKVGVWENYQVSKWYEATPKEMRDESHVKWELYHVNKGKPELVLEKEIGHFRFQSRAIGEKFLISAHVYTPDLHGTSTMEVSVVDNDKPAILGVDITDINDQKLSKPAFATQTLNVHVRTVGMVGHHVTISLWEDEKDFMGKKTGKKKIVLEIPKRVGSKGIAHCQFVIPRDAMGMFKAMTGQGDQQAEYHVTAYALGLLKASATTPRVDHEERKAETKDKLEGVVKPKPSVPPVKRNVPVVTPKPTTPAVPRAPQSPAEEHRDAELRKITNIYFTDDKGKFIREAGYNSIINLNIVSTNLIGSKIKLTVKDKDLTDSDILVKEKEHDITGNHIIIPIPLTVGMQIAGGDIGYQNLYVDIVVLATSKHLVTVPINVDLKATSYDPITNVTKFMVEKSEVKKEEKKKEKKGDCFCEKDLTVEILENVGVSNKKATEFLEAINKTFIDYKINTCLRKTHFLAQIIHESVGFKFTEELYVSDTEYGGYKGRGLMQLTGKSNYEAYGKYENEDFTSSLDNKKKLENLPYSARLAGWFWTESAKLNDDADLNDHINITRIINGGINGYNDRTKNIKKGFEILYKNCVNDTDKNSEYKFNTSKCFNNKRGCFAWGLWHDPDLKKDGCTKDKEKAIEGYTRFIELAGENYSEIDWYNIKKITSFKNLQYAVGKKLHIKVIDAAKQRLEELNK